MSTRRDPEQAKAWRARSKPLKRGKGLRPRSKKMDRLYSKPGGRRELVERLLAERKHCEIRWDERCQGRATTVHEIVSRARGGSILDPANCLAACVLCHDAVTFNPREATLRGFLKRREVTAA